MAGHKEKAADKPAAKPADKGHAEGPAKPERKVQPLENQRMEEADFKRTVMVATAHQGTMPEDLLKPEYWAYVSGRLKPWDEIVVRADDGTWLAKYLITEAGRTYARAHMMEQHNLSTRDVALSANRLVIGEYEVLHRGEHQKWSVVRTNDRAVVHEFEETQGGAVNWATERIKADR